KYATYWTSEIRQPGVLINCVQSLGLIFFIALCALCIRFHFLFNSSSADKSCLRSRNASSFRSFIKLSYRSGETAPFSTEASTAQPGSETCRQSRNRHSGER